MATASRQATGDVTWFAEQFEALATNVEKFIRGKSSVVRTALVCMLAEGHLLVDDVPGVGKTVLAKAISSSIDGRMSRIQFTPDLLPTDVTGVNIYEPSSGEFRFHAGGIFANVVLGDEINRASPKTQSAMLEVMEERQVTVDAVPYAVPRPFLVIATQNPVEFSGTYPLPEAQVDRFMMKIGMGYPSPEAEVEILTQRTHGDAPEHLEPVTNVEDMERLIDIGREVYLSPAVYSYIVTIAAATRKMPELRLGVSPRGSLALARAAQSLAASAGRSFVTPDDVKSLAAPVLAHRLLVLPEYEVAGVTGSDLLQKLLVSVPVPRSERIEV